MKINTSHAVYFPLLLFLLNTVVTCFISILVYPETYLFWEYHISDLGATMTPAMVPNPTAWIFWAGMIINLGIGIFGSIYLKPIMFKFFNLWVGIGCLCVAFPTDIFVTLHRAGAVFMFFGFWFYAICALLVSVKSPFKFIIPVVISVINTIYVLLSFEVLIGNNPLWQKIAFLSTIIFAILGVFFVEKKAYYAITIEIPDGAADRCYFKCF